MAKKKICNDKNCQYRYCKLHPLGCVIRNEEERMLSGYLCRKLIVRLVDAIYDDKEDFE